jgi:hypothetical protein
MYWIKSRGLHRRGRGGKHETAPQCLMVPESKLAECRIVLPQHCFVKFGGEIDFADSEAKTLLRRLLKGKGHRQLKVTLVVLASDACEGRDEEAQAEVVDLAMRKGWRVMKVEFDRFGRYSY